MKRLELLSGCGCCGLSRRQFLAAGCGTCVSAAALLSSPLRARAMQGSSPTRIRIVYALHGEKQAGPDWPNKGFDFGPVMARTKAELTQRCPGFEFINSMATGPEQAKAIADGDKAGGIDGYLVYQLNCWNRVVQTLAATGKPVLYADFQFGGSGGFLVYTAGFLRNKAPNVGFVASSKIEDLAEAVNMELVMVVGNQVPDAGFGDQGIRLKAHFQLNHRHRVVLEARLPVLPDCLVKG